MGTALGWSTLGRRIDNYVSDILVSAQRPLAIPPQSAVVAIDEATLRSRGGMRNIRGILTETLIALQDAQPKAIGIDLILSDGGVTQGNSSDAAALERQDAALEAAMRATPNLILSADLVGEHTGERWEEPLPRFAQWAKAVGHVHPEIDRLDGVSRAVSLEQTANHVRHWALALEAFRLARNEALTESPDDLAIGGLTIPASRDTARQLQIRYLTEGIPTVPALEVRQRNAELKGRAVFLGVTALSAARDRLLNPYGQNVPGVEVHAHIFETLARGSFIRPVSDAAGLGFALLLVALVGLMFWFFSGWRAYAMVVLVLIAAHVVPVAAFRNAWMMPYFGPALSTWLASACAATFQVYYTRKQLRRAEAEKSRYQEAIQWAAHEMRTPLTAIQGSSEIMTRYSLPEAKSRQLSEMIHSESKRLARLIQTFLDVERLADGQMELKSEVFEASDIVDTCLKRVATLAERKEMRISLETPVEGSLRGDRELMEYALYNLLTNAIKYSPAGTHVTVEAATRKDELRLAVRDQGMGMDAKELKQIFQKFYRTARAEASGETGSGIGLSIVQQIVAHHGGRMEVTSQPGKGSCFTMILRIFVAETVDR